MTGIYKITCLSNNKCYIGQSVSIKRRITTHKRELRTNTHYNQKLQRAYNKYGQNNFTYEILELCSKEKLNEREQFYIKLFDSYNNGFNADFGGSNINGKNNPMYQKSGVLSPRFIDYIYQLDTKGNIINTYESANLAAKVIKGNSAHILDCLKTWKEHKPIGSKSSERMTHLGYQWIYKKDYELLTSYGYDFSKKRTKKSITIKNLINEGTLNCEV